MRLLKRNKFCILFLVILLMTISLSTAKGYAGINGTVVDNDTGKPIEGAIVLVEWTKTKGVPGMTHTESYKVVEKVTNNVGKFTISGVLNPLVSRPNITVYKKGYVAWNNKFIFPDYAKRTDFAWQKSYVFKLAKFKDNYSYIKHQSFIKGAIHVGLSRENKQQFLRVYNDGEQQLVIMERRRRDKMRNNK